MITISIIMIMFLSFMIGRETGNKHIFQYNIQNILGLSMGLTLWIVSLILWYNKG